MGFSLKKLGKAVVKSVSAPVKLAGDIVKGENIVKSIDKRLDDSFAVMSETQKTIVNPIMNPVDKLAKGIGIDTKNIREQNLKFMKGDASTGDKNFQRATIDVAKVGAIAYGGGLALDAYVAGGLTATTAGYAVGTKASVDVLNKAKNGGGLDLKTLAKSIGLDVPINATLIKPKSNSNVSVNDPYYSTSGGYDTGIKSNNGMIFALLGIGAVGLILILKRK